MLQGIYESSAIQNYPIGMRYAIDERVFRYGQIYGVDALGGRAVANLATAEEAAVAAAGSLVGATTVTITVQAAAGLAQNELRGGYLCYKNVRYYRHRIRSHPAAGSGATCVLTLETALVGHAVTNGVTVLCAYHSPWARVGFGATYGSGVSFVGWPFGDIAVGQYTWLQTWGPANGAPAVFFGDVPNERAVWFASDGSLTTFHAGDSPCSYQYAGFWMPCNWYGGALNAMSDGGHLVFLQIAP